MSISLRNIIPVFIVASIAFAPTALRAQADETQLTVAGVVAAVDHSGSSAGAGASLGMTFPFKEKFAIEGRVSFFQDDHNLGRFAARSHTTAIDGDFFLRQPLTAASWRVYGGGGVGVVWTPDANSPRPSLQVAFGVEWEFTRDRSIAARFELLDRQVFGVSRNIAQGSAGISFRF